MNKYIHFMAWSLVAILVAIGFNACSEESTSNGAYGNVKATFDKMKGNYKGKFSKANGTLQELSFSIDQQANVVVASFPLDNVMAKLYPNDYEHVTYSGEALNYTCSIDSVGIPADGQLSFVTSDDLAKSRVDFSYTKDNQSHNGYILVKTKGVYNSLMNALSINFIVTDLIVDNTDYTSALCPVNTYIDIAQHQ